LSQKLVLAALAIIVALVAIVAAYLMYCTRAPPSSVDDVIVRIKMTSMLSSTASKDSGYIPGKYTCNGEASTFLLLK